MDFNSYINRETNTIEEFGELNKPITITDIINEGFSPYDFTFISAGTKNQWYTPEITGVGEAKTRNYSSEHYGGGVLLELGKYTGVIQAVCEEKNKFENINKTIKPYYLVKYTNKTFVFDLEQVTLGEIHYKKIQKTTASNGSSEYITKAIFILDEYEAVLTY